MTTSSKVMQSKLVKHSWIISKKQKDPRIHVYCSLKDGNTEFDKQFGLPNGYDSHTIADAPSVESFCRLRKYFQLQYQYNFEIGCPLPSS